MPPLRNVKERKEAGLGFARQNGFNWIRVFPVSGGSSPATYLLALPLQKRISFPKDRLSGILIRLETKIASDRTAAFRDTKANCTTLSRNASRLQPRSRYETQVSRRGFRRRVPLKSSTPLLTDDTSSTRDSCPTIMTLDNCVSAMVFKSAEGSLCR